MNKKWIDLKHRCILPECWYKFSPPVGTDDFAKFQERNYEIYLYLLEGLKCEMKEKYNPNLIKDLLK